jgi:hypothetical protein
MSSAITRCKLPPGDEWWYQVIAFGEAPSGVQNGAEDGEVVTYLEAILRLNQDRPPADRRRGAHAADRVRGKCKKVGRMIRGT